MTNTVNRYNNEYTRDKALFIISIMIKFNLCFEKNEKLFIPSLLNSSLTIRLEDSYLDWYKFIIRYRYLPAIVFQKFIVMHYEDIFQNMVWNSGAMLVIEETKVIILRTTNEINVYISDENKQKRRDCLTIVRNTFRYIHCEMKFEENSIEELILLKELGRTAVYPYNDLKILLEMNVKTVPIPKLKKVYSVRDILGEYENIVSKEVTTMSFYINNGNAGTMGDKAHSEQNHEHCI